MLRQNSSKVASRRWPLHVFYNVLDMAVVNSWIIYKETLKSNITRRNFTKRLCEELVGHNNEIVPHVLNAAGDQPVERKRRTCHTGRCNRNKTTDLCSVCQKPICGRCRPLTCPNCINN